jgi:hypothetical protein
MGIKAISNLCKKNNVIYDLKYLFDKNQTQFEIINIFFFKIKILNIFTK